MIGLAVKGIEKLNAKLHAAHEGMRQATVKAMTRATVLVGARLRKEMKAPESRHPFWGKVGAKTLGLSVRSGKTRASLTAGTRVYRVGDNVVGVVGSAEKHLKLHEDGATVSGTSPRGYARIPTANAQTPAGVDRYAGRSIKDIPGAFLQRTKSGKLWAMREAGGKRSGRLEFLYLLVKSIRLKPRHIFARTARASAAEVKAETQGHVTAVVRKANS